MALKERPKRPLLLGFLVGGKASTFTLRYFSKAPPLAAIFTCFFLFVSSFHNKLLHPFSLSHPLFH
ncbi:hypothetical protein OIU76_016274 [Salix suchowensis]|uniref:Uncharacterized protein n=1 Tax=Salix koriyanagi TaxID=2511006 RepID=A0A9Q0W1W5_9ROSI|nr:hypothetical protein OIU76_016274 [Salix suchowensis]KAJ6383851.1 hypothetical protein OIU78_027198 [Salix suchowensis]KAJ6757748.1 hypothetical protein OIU74_026924 [Salix koriyanagi]